MGARLKDHRTSTLLIMLLAVDCVLVCLHFSLLTPYVSSKMLALNQDEGYPEFFQYIKEFWIIVLLTMLLVRTRIIGFGVWIILFLYLLIDDSVRIHEKVGVIIAEKLQLPSVLDLQPHDLGELIVSGTVGSVVMVLLILFYVLSKETFKQATRHLLLLMMVLVFFGVGIDMLHNAVKMGPTIDYLFLAMEDGGEMIAISLIAWYLYALNLQGGKIDPPEKEAD